MFEITGIINCLFFMTIIAFTPGLFGSICSLILLKLKKDDQHYDGISHYYSIIFFTDLIIILIYPLQGWTYGFDYIININFLWTNESIFCLILCKLVK